MTFRSSDSKPLAYLVHSSGASMECRILGFDPDGLIVSAPKLRSIFQGRFPLEIHLALDGAPNAPQSRVPATLIAGSPERDEYRAQLDQPRVVWKAALASQSSNRRQAFRVRNLAFGADRPQPGMELTSTVVQGSSHLEGEILNLSLGGCNLRFLGRKNPELPRVGARVLCVLEGPALGEALRLPSIVKRHFNHTRNPRVGLKFQAKDNPAWLRAEYRLQDYLMERQRQHLRFRPAG